MKVSKKVILKLEELILILNVLQVGIFMKEKEKDFIVKR
jgi:hypothetical protein